MFFKASRRSLRIVSTVALVEMMLKASLFQLVKAPSIEKLRYMAGPLC